MATILLTRPLKDSERLAARLKTLGYDSVIQPLLIIKPTDAPMPNLNGISAIMITSTNAISALTAAGHRDEALLKLPCFCVGSNTAHSAEKFGFHQVFDAAGDGATLALLVGSTTGGTVLHIAGRDVDSKAQDNLRQKGVNVVVWNVYAADAAEEFAPATIDALRQNKLQGVLLFSARTAETLVTLIQKHGLEACCAPLSAVGISDAVIDRLHPLSWRQAVSSPLPSEDSMIERLQEIIPHD